MARPFLDIGDIGGGDLGGGDFGQEEISQITNALSTGTGASSSILDQVTLPDISATANDLFLPTGNSFRALTSGGAQTVTGFANGMAGRQVVFMNVGVDAITLANDNAGSTEQNRILTGIGGDLVIQPDRSAMLTYDGEIARWRVTSFT